MKVEAVQGKEGEDENDIVLPDSQQGTLPASIPSLLGPQTDVLYSTDRVGLVPRRHVHRADKLEEKQSERASEEEVDELASASPLLGPGSEAPLTVCELTAPGKNHPGARPRSRLSTHLDPSRVLLPRPAPAPAPAPVSIPNSRPLKSSEVKLEAAQV